MPREMTAEELIELYAPKVPKAAGGIDSLEEMNKRKVRRDIRRGQRQGFGPSPSYGRDIKQPTMPTPTTSSRAAFMGQAGNEFRTSFMAQQEAMANARQDDTLARIRAARAIESKKAKE